MYTITENVQYGVAVRVSYIPYVAPHLGVLPLVTDIVTGSSVDLCEEVQELTLCTCVVCILKLWPPHTLPGYHSADNSTNDSHLEYYEPCDKGNVLQGHQLHCRRPRADYILADISAVVGRYWYHGDISRKVAEERLIAEDSDCFLVRKSQSQEGKIVLSVYYREAIKHFIIHTGNECYEVDGSQNTFKSLQELVEYYQKNSLLAHEEVLLVIPCQGMSRHYPIEALHYFNEGTV